MPDELNDLSVLDDVDIPELVRNEVPVLEPLPSAPKRNLTLTIGLIGGFLVLGGAIALMLNQDPTILDATDSNSELDAGLPIQGAFSPDQEQLDQILGHFPYEEATPADLVAITADGRLKLRPAAAEKINQLVSDARQAGISIALLSAFRSVEEQEYLFFGIKEQRGQAAAKRAEVSAPPHHSEHHTGYAIDFGDANYPETHLAESFEDTPAFKWLEANAPRYSFELSFPRDNPQGIAYEPWHWRFVGDQDSLETFYKTRNTNSNS